MGNTKSPDISRATVALSERDPRISTDNKQSLSPVTSFIGDPALELNFRLTTLESSRNPTEIDPRTRKAENICDLNDDLILYLVDFLPPDSAALLSLCCKNLWERLGSRYVEALNNPYRATSFPVQAMYKYNLNIQLYRSYRYNFLRLLARDLPNYVTCYPCNKLHTIGLAYSERLLEKSCAFHIDNALPLLEGHVSFHVLQAAMKRYHQRHIPHSISLYNVTTTFLNPKSRLVEYSRETIRISQTTNSLIFCKQRILLLPANHDHCTSEDFSEDTSQAPDAWAPEWLTWDHPICPHLKWNLYYDFRWRTLSVSDRSLTSPRFQSCDYCMTDYHVAVQDRQGEGDALYLTCWQDLGSGKSARDFNWQNAIANVTSQDRQGSDKVSRFAYEHGSVCEAFEGVSGEEYKFYESMREQDWEAVNGHSVSRARDVLRKGGKREKTHPLKILTVKDDSNIRSWIQ
ncbi:uncharacterized protein EAE97_010665 [Botrytis byssoidea]|uniref:F-box domain-containing protein n=1 Tax=Botrytis byssoidea TaxID=139641 RepID=A0A9P5HWB2_9HELO|nr:uncharacterized protein EAE97_010665 [Botrytis byssoidea]KAF7924714.1 hypothetical protein EAE97_010665 [Botrytis byssoidea]